MNQPEYVTAQTSQGPVKVPAELYTQAVEEMRVRDEAERRNEILPVGPACLEICRMAGPGLKAVLGAPE